MWTATNHLTFHRAFAATVRLVNETDREERSSPSRSSKCSTVTHRSPIADCAARGSRYGAERSRRITEWATERAVVAAAESLSAACSTGNWRRSTPSFGLLMREWILFEFRTGRRQGGVAVKYEIKRSEGKRRSGLGERSRQGTENGYKFIAMQQGFRDNKSTSPFTVCLFIARMVLFSTREHTVIIKSEWNTVLRAIERWVCMEVTVVARTWFPAVSVND